MHQRGGSVQKTGPDNRIQIIRGKGKVREEIFKENTSDQVKSPENLDSFIQVANPSVWILLISVVILLSGACVWAFFGHVNSTVKTIVHAENGSYICYVSEENISAVQVGKAVKIDGFDAVISHHDGALYAIGYHVTEVNTAVRPAMWIDIEKLI